MNLVNAILDHLKTAGMMTLNQFLAALGIFFVFGFILYLLGRFTRNTFVNSVGYKADMFWTGWIGTPVHELGHAIFCVLFGHQITEMRLFKPDPRSGSLGYVNHSYNSRNLYHKIGNLFIGVGPIILGALVIYAAMYYLAPNRQIIKQIMNTPGVALNDMATLKAQFFVLLQAGEQTVKLLLSGINPKSYMFWIFLYLSISIAAHMELSIDDLKGMWSGLLTLLVLLFVVNLAASLMSFNINQFIMKGSGYTGMFVGLFIFAVIISAANFLLAFVVLNLYSLIRFRKLVNPIG